MYLAIECEVCGKPRHSCECTYEETLDKAGRVDMHTYIGVKRRAEVFLYKDKTFGCDFYETIDDVESFVKSETYKEHSESFAEDAAENYVGHIKNFEENKT
jgi:hypothetical protein